METAPAREGAATGARSKVSELRRWSVKKGCRWRERRALPEAGGDQDDEGGEQNGEEADGSLADGLGSAQVPGGAGEDDGQLPERGAGPRGEAGRDAGEIEDEDDRVDGHVEDAGGEREPCLLKSPEGAEGAAHPAVVAALLRQGGGELADHERGGQAPDQRDEEQEEEGAAVAGVAEDVFQAVGATGDHEVGGCDEREQTHLAVGFAHAPASGEDLLLRRIYLKREGRRRPINGAGEIAMERKLDGRLAS